MTEKKVYYTWENFDKDVIKIIKKIFNNMWDVKGVYAIPKGGLVLGVKLANLLKVPLYTKLCKEVEINHNILIVDEISDTGKTLNKIPNIKKYNTVCLHIKEGTSFMPDIYIQKFKRDEWIVYPWEGVANYK